MEKASNVKSCTQNSVQNFIINLDSDFGKKLGFTHNKFDGYLWKDGNYIYISFIISKKKGNLKALFQRIEQLGYGIKVPTPFSRMREIVMKQGFKPTQEWFEEAYEWCEVWVKEGKRRG